MNSLKREELSRVIIVWAALLFCIGVWWLIVALITGLAFGQSPQQGARVSYVQCPPDMTYDPARSYEKFTRRFGTSDNPVMCTEFVDRKPDGARCQVAFVCEDAT